MGLFGAFLNVFVSKRFPPAMIILVSVVILTREMGYRNTYPPDGGVTVSVIRRTDRDAPHSTDTSWGKHFGWYLMKEDQPLLVFRLEDCTDLAWYGPELLKD